MLQILWCNGDSPILQDKRLEFFCALNAKTRIPVALRRAGLLDLVPFPARSSPKSERFHSDRGELSLQIEHIAQ